MSRNIIRKNLPLPAGVSEHVFKALVRPGQADKLREHLAPHAWPNIVNAVVRQATRGLFVKNGTLYVAAKSSAWVTELGMQKVDLLQRINKYLGASTKPLIHDIRFLNQPWDEPKIERDVLKPWRATPLPTEERTLIQRIAALADVAVERDNARREAGWIACRACGDLIEPGGPDDPTRCTFCRNER